MSFNIIIATIGRASLQRMLDSLVDELEYQDCLTIVFDGHSHIPEVFDLTQFKCKIVQYYEPIALGSWGHGIRNKYATILDKRDFIMHADDDDVYLPGVFSELREKCTNPNTIYIAKIYLSMKQLRIPSGHFIRFGHIGTPNGVIPYESNSMAQWGPGLGGDGEFYLALEKLAISIEFLDLVIYMV
jgi:hypothetical protein